MPNPKEILPYDERVVSEYSKRFASQLFSSFPELKEKALMERSKSSDNFSLLVEIPSPSGDRQRQITIWMDEENEPSIEFGQWHTHSSVLLAESTNTYHEHTIMEIVEAIFEDKLVLIEDVGGEYEGHQDILDLRKKDSLEDALTSPYSPNRLKVKSWSGKIDREISVEMDP